jgi:hypothetical protein
MEPNHWCHITMREGAVQLTTIIDPLGAHFPGTVLFENGFGGRIATYAGCVDLNYIFFNHQRIKWINALLDWANRSRFPVSIESPQRLLTIRRDGPTQILLAFANFTADRLDEVKGSFKNIEKIESWKRLSGDGSW